MKSMIIIAPVLFAVTFLVYQVFRNLVRVWVEHRFKMYLLEKLEKNPTLVSSFDEVQEMLESGSSDPESKEGLNYTQTGVILTILGTCCVLFYGVIGIGRWAVGAYWGGVICVVIGFILVLLGLLTHFLSRPPKAL